MSKLIAMIKMNLKLLFRNKGYLCFVVILPILSVLLLNIPEMSYDLDEADYSVHELEEGNQTLLNMLNTKMSIKVYDASHSYASDYILSQLAQTGSYQIYRYKITDETLETVKKDATLFANRNNIGAAIYIDSNLTKAILEDQVGQSVYLLEATKDERMDILNENINTFLQGLRVYAKLSDYKEASIKDLIQQEKNFSVQKNIVDVAVGNALNLTREQQNQSTNIGYSLAVITMAFLFGGVFIAGIVVEEKQNKVMTRIMLTNSGMLEYALVKMFLSVITVLIQLFFMTIGILFFVKTDFGIPMTSYLLFIFSIGLIFNLLSVVAGILMDDTLSANYFAFFVWSLSAMLAGLYFPLDAAENWWAKISLLMPQRWVIKSSEMLMSGEPGVYSMFLLVTLGFITIILSTGYLGIKISRKE